KAGELYARVNQMTPEALGDGKERWAYCQMQNVAERLNNQDKPVAAADLPALEQQVRKAMALTPKLESVGNTLLSSLQARRDGGKERRRRAETTPAAPTAPAVDVKHTREEGASEAIAETKNFRIHHNLDRDEAEKVARLCEAARAAAQKRWFGRVLPDWAPKCDAHLYPNADAYSRATGVNGNSPGHAENGTEGERVVLRKLHFRLDHPNVLNTVLPHETAHVVLAGNF